MDVSPEGGGNITSPNFTSPADEYPKSYTCSKNYTLTAVRANGYEFIDWFVNGTIYSENPLALSVSDGIAKDVTAYFRLSGAANNPPVADAGPDQPANEGDQVILDGSNTSDPDNDIRSYAWKQFEGSAVTLANADSATPSFIAPNVTGDPITLKFRLTVSDIPGLTDTDTVSVTVHDSGVDGPVADAGADQEAVHKTTVTLDASGSFDSNDNIKSYSWQQTEGVDVTLSDPSLINPTFVAPEVISDPITLTFELVVEDFTGLTDEDTITITVTRGQIGGTTTSAGCFLFSAFK